MFISSFGHEPLVAMMSRSSQTQVFCSECPCAFTPQAFLSGRKRSHDCQILRNGQIPSTTSCQPTTTSITVQKQGDSDKTTTAYCHEQSSETSIQLGGQLKKQQMTSTGTESHIRKLCDSSCSVDDLTTQQYVHGDRKSVG